MNYFYIDSNTMYTQYVLFNANTLNFADFVLFDTRS